MWLNRKTEGLCWWFDFSLCGCMFEVFIFFLSNNHKIVSMWGEKLRKIQIKQYIKYFWSIKLLSSESHRIILFRFIDVYMYSSLFLCLFMFCMFPSYSIYVYLINYNLFPGMYVNKHKIFDMCSLATFLYDSVCLCVCEGRCVLDLNKIQYFNFSHHSSFLYHRDFIAESSSFFLVLNHYSSVFFTWFT